LSEHDIEPEETAQKAAIADVVATLDEREQKEIQAINRALMRMEFGKYGSCEVCGKKIEVERLETIPGHLSAANMREQNEGANETTQRSGLCAKT